MDFFELILKRHSIRRFKPKEVEPEKLRTILHAANRAPSAGNLQAYDIVMVRRKKTLNELVRAALGQKFIAEAPLALVFLANTQRSAATYGMRGANLYCIQDADIACAYAHLAAAALGLGSVWVGAFRENDVARIVMAADYQKPVAILPIGYADEDPPETSRRTLADLVREIV